ncbi:hypothetical protein Mgra_00010112 [Meloidogyne graminicola]|uniref:Uncharacterized protein n=1 Tax=Meloidogyne graminicola TaxID=189291 RepID=A0A8S9Z8F1_9BILA|nr:hypothetical protein Mgra_00010109 [Meloidogyne graminicola]KAF7623594.1 hypothetical protein Mgra_00010112 [Meloidogyne graminicola]
MGFILREKLKGYLINLKSIKFECNNPLYSVNNILNIYEIDISTDKKDVYCIRNQNKIKFNESQIKEIKEKQNTLEDEFKDGKKLKKQCLNLTKELLFNNYCNIFVTFCPDYLSFEIVEEKPFSFMDGQQNIFTEECKIDENEQKFREKLISEKYKKEMMKTLYHPEGLPKSEEENGFEDKIVERMFKTDRKESENLNKKCKIIEPKKEIQEYEGTLIDEKFFKQKLMLKQENFGSGNSTFTSKNNLLQLNKSNLFF